MDVQTFITTRKPHHPCCPSIFATREASDAPTLPSPSSASSQNTSATPCTSIKHPKHRCNSVHLCSHPALHRVTSSACHPLKKSMAVLQNLGGLAEKLHVLAPIPLAVLPQPRHLIPRHFRIPKSRPHARLAPPTPCAQPLTNPSSLAIVSMMAETQMPCYSAPVVDGTSSFIGGVSWPWCVRAVPLPMR